jgi:hypothetical protein
MDPGSGAAFGAGAAGLGALGLKIASAMLRASVGRRVIRQSFASERFNNHKQSRTQFAWVRPGLFQSCLIPFRIIPLRNEIAKQRRSSQALKLFRPRARCCQTGPGDCGNVRHFLPRRSVALRGTRPADGSLGINGELVVQFEMLPLILCDAPACSLVPKALIRSL